MSSQTTLLNDGVFWIAIATLFVGSIKYALKYVPRNLKIKKFSCLWGCCSSERDTEAEVDIEKIRIEHNLEKADTNSEDSENKRNVSKI